MAADDYELVERVLDADVLKEIHEYGIALDGDTIYLEAPLEFEDADGVSWFMSRKFQKNLAALLREEAVAITVDINTPGGECVNGMSIYDAIKMCPVPVTGLVTGEASSMGCIILQACDERVLYPHALVMWHPGHTDISAPGSEAKAYIKWDEKLGDRMMEIVYERVREKQPNLTFSEFELATLRGIYLNAQEAVDYGLADKIAEYPRKKKL